MVKPQKPDPAQDIDSICFEDAFRRLSETVESLETGGLTLAEATARYQEGMSLVHRCNQLLNETELRVRELKDSYDTPIDVSTWDDEEPGVL